MRIRGQARVLTPTLAICALATATRGQSLVHEFFGDAVNDQLGSAVLTSGDVDGDGIGDVVLAAAQGAALRGRVRAHSGATGALLWQLDGPAQNVGFGCALADLGDVDGDGLADLVIGSDRHNGSTGRVYVVSGADGATLRVHTGLGFGDRFGRAVAAADVDGDGVRDVLVGIPDDDDNGFSSGSMHAYSGGDGAQLLDVDGLAAQEHFGSAIARLGDVDGDGRDDLAVGGPGNPSTGAPGLVRIVSGAGAVLAVHAGTAAGGAFGSALAGPGDVDGDGQPDVLIGAWRWGNGRAQVRSALSGAVLIDVAGTPSRLRLGLSVAAAGDVDYDGRADVLIGTPEANENGSRSGVVLLVSGADGSTMRELLGTGIGVQLGSALSGGVDLTGGGSPDHVVGALGDPTAGAQAGAATAWSGNDVPPPVVDPPRTDTLIATPETLSVRGGGSQRLAFDGGVEHAHLRYLVLATMSGTEPGFTMGGQHVPLNPDLWMMISMHRRCGFGLIDGRGRLDENGRANAEFRMPRRFVSARMAGTTIHHAVLVFGGWRRPVFVSNPAPLTLTR